MNQFMVPQAALTRPPLIPCPDSSPDLGLATPCSFYPNISNFEWIYVMIVLRDEYRQKLRRDRDTEDKIAGSVPRHRAYT